MRIVLLLLFMSVVPMHFGWTFNLIHEGRSDYVIVLPPEPIPPEQTAAAELQHFLAEVTGATLPIVGHGDMDHQAKRIMLGVGPELAAVFPGLNVDAMGRDATVVKTKGDTLYLAGDRPRGTLYAVYTFLEDTVGCRWWTADAQFIPRRPTVEVPALDLVYAPTIICREAYYKGTTDGVFAARQKLNGHSMQITPEYGGHYRILGWCHTFEQLLPADTYFDAHPEWYSEIDGKRVKERSQLCLTNDEARKALTEKALEWIRNDPDAGMISISQNDWHNRCRCAKCRALEKKEGSPSGPLLYFVNAVAADIEREFPHVLVSTLAYQYTREAPKHVRPRKNVVIRLCSIECDFSQPLATGKRNADFKRDIEAWSAIAGKIYIWNYVTNFQNLILPHPNYRVLAPNLRFFAEHKAIGLFEQGDAGSWCSDFPEMRAWLLAHLMWDPSRDENALMKTFMEGYYGKAARPLLQYITILADAMEASGAKLRCFEQDTGDWFHIKTVNRATRLFDEAEAAVADEPPLLKRVRRARLPLDHVWLNRYRELKGEAKRAGEPFLGPEDPAAFAEAFVERVKATGEGWYREGQPFSKYVPTLLGRFRAQGPPPAELRDAAPDTYVDIQDNHFALHNLGDWVTLVKDEKASDGMAARIRGGHTQWAVQLPVTDDMVELGKARCRVVVRCEGWEKEHPAFRLGLWDRAEKRNVVDRTVFPGELTGEGYTTIDLGLRKLTLDRYFWVAPCEALTRKDAVFVDRIYCVKEQRGRTNHGTKQDETGFRHG